MMAPDRCSTCEWSNTYLMNYGSFETGPNWLCHGCAARAIQQLAAAKEEAARWRKTYEAFSDEWNAQVTDLRGRLDAALAAKDEACDGWERCRQPNPYDKGDRARIAELRKVGKP